MLLKFLCADGEVVQGDFNIAKSSVTIKTMVEDLGLQEDDEEIVTLPHVNGCILRKVFQWANYHKDDLAPAVVDENTEKDAYDIPSWDADFLKMPQHTLLEIISAANYLDIKGLLDVTCKTVANMINGKTPDEIRKTFDLKNNFTAAEEDQMCKENDWCDQ